MFDIDRYLNEIELKELKAPEALVQQTQSKCADVGAKIGKRKKTVRKLRKAALIGLPAAAVLIIGVVIGAFMFGGVPAGADNDSAYYTVDINPSVCLYVDSTDTVQRVTGINDDAKELLTRIDCVGKPAVEAIEIIITEAKDSGFISDDGKYVLVGRFDEKGRPDSALEDMQAYLEANFGDMIELLVVTGTLEDMQLANALDVSAGMLKLSELADGIEVSEEDKVEDVIDEVNKTNQSNFSAPVLSVDKTSFALSFSWRALDFDAMGYLGEVTYKIVAADSYASVTNMTADVLKTFTFQSTGDQPRSWSMPLASNTLCCDDRTYFGIYAVYSDGTVAISNVVSQVMPSPSPSATPAPSATTTPAPTEDPGDPGGLVSGRVSGDYVILNWKKDDSSNLAGYKIVASRTNPNPKYPDDGYLKYITNRNTTSLSMYEGYKGLQGNTYYYFSVTYLYNDGTTVAANAVRLKVPDKEEDPDPTDPPDRTPGDMVGTNISGSLSDTKVNLNWSAVSHSDFQYYKVVAAKHANPSYPADGYINVITNAAITSATYNISDFDAGETYWFAITVVYTNGTKLTNNDVALTMPGTPEPTPSPTPTPTDEPYVTATISGSLGETHVSLNWSMVDHSKFQGYKVVAAKHANPSYPSDGYLSYITNAGSTSYSKAIDGFDPGETYYFAITVLYTDGTRMTGNDIAITMPEAPEE